MKIMAASQLYAQAMSSCCCWTFTFVTVILAVAAIAGAQYSAFVIFIPQFTIAGLVVCCLTCVICCLRSDLEDEYGEALRRGEEVMCVDEVHQPRFSACRNPAPTYRHDRYFTANVSHQVCAPPSPMCRLCWTQK